MSIMNFFKKNIHININISLSFNNIYIYIYMYMRIIKNQICIELC